MNDQPTTNLASSASVAAQFVSGQNSGQGRARQIALVRRPGPRLADGLVTHVERTPVDLARATEQWTKYVAVLQSAGWEVIEVDPADECPDATFVEDAIVMFRNVAVITRPGADERKPETAAVEAIAERLGCSINRIRPPGTLDGGDVLKVGDTVYVGSGGRTNGEGIRQLRAILEPIGALVIAVAVTKVLHLKSAVTALPDGTVIGYPPAVDDPAIYHRYRPVPEESGAHVVLLGGDQLLMAADAPQSAAMFRSLGYDPIEVDISEFVKLEGCVTCLSVRVRDFTPAPRQDTEMRTILHLITRTDWEGLAGSAIYEPPSLGVEGFVHCTDDVDTLVGVANRFYRSIDGEVLLLELDVAKIDSDVIWESPAHVDGSPSTADEPRFPHVYGSIPLAAVTRIRRFIRGRDGGYLGVAQD